MTPFMDAPLIGMLFPPLAYLLGSIPFGLFIVRLVSGADIRRRGSGNIGATNVSRMAGTRWGILALALDGLKGAVPTWAAIHFSADGSSWLPAATILAAVCGHIFPIYLKFKACGKGVATAAGCFLVTAPVACIISLLTFVATVRWSRRVSAGSLAGTVALPPAIWFSIHDPAIVFSGIFVMGLILSRHKENIQRLANGREPPWSGRTK